MSHNDNLLGRTEKTGFAFLMTDLDLAMTMAQIAAQAAQDQQKRLRNRENARRAYDAVVQLSHKAILNESEREQLNEKLGRLKSELETLGEKF